MSVYMLTQITYLFHRYSLKVSALYWNPSLCHILQKLCFLYLPKTNVLKKWSHRLLAYILFSPVLVSVHSQNQLNILNTHSFIQKMRSSLIFIICFPTASNNPWKTLTCYTSTKNIVMLCFCFPCATNNFNWKLRHSCIKQKYVNANKFAFKE